MNDKESKIKHLVSQVNESDLSSIKNVVSGIIRIINDPRSTAKDLKEIMSIDPPLTARVLRLANSVYYSPKKRITEIEQAVIWVGFDALKELALNQKVGEIFTNDSVNYGFSRSRLWRHSVAVALFSKLLYRREFGDRGESAYVAGLLHDIGILAEEEFETQKFVEVLKLLHDEMINLEAAENATLGFNHMETGQAIIHAWNLPKELSLAIGKHHNPFPLNETSKKLSCTLFLADYLTRKRDIGYGELSFPLNDMINQALEALNVEMHALELIMNDVQVEIGKMEVNGLL